MSKTNTHLLVYKWNNHFKKGGNGLGYTCLGLLLLFMFSLQQLSSAQVYTEPVSPSCLCLCESCPLIQEHGSVLLGPWQWALSYFASNIKVKVADVRAGRSCKRFSRLFLCNSAWSDYMGWASSGVLVTNMFSLICTLMLMLPGHVSMQCLAKCLCADKGVIEVTCVHSNFKVSFSLQFYMFLI